jgi:hypothetical protein
LNAELRVGSLAEAITVTGDGPNRTDHFVKLSGFLICAG